MNLGSLVRYKQNEWTTDRVLREVGIVVSENHAGYQVKVKWQRPWVPIVWERIEGLVVIDYENR